MARRAPTVVALCACAVLLLLLALQLDMRVLSTSGAPRLLPWQDANALSDSIIAERLSRRRQRILNSCREYENDTTITDGRIPSGQYQVGSVLWLQIPQAGSTTVTTLLLRKIFNKASLTCKSAWRCDNILWEYRAARQDSQTPAAEQQIASSTMNMPPGEGGSLLVVRDPVSRLVSAYVEKVLEGDDLGLWIQIRQDPNPGMKEANWTSPPTFREFAKFVIWRSNAGRVLDDHWETQEALSEVCSRDYQYIMQAESLWEELPFVARQLGLERFIYEPLTADFQSSYDPAEMWKQLTEEQREELENIYAMDKILFGS